MAKIDVNGIGIAYEIFGKGDRTVGITAGGRYSKDTPGPRDLAQALADAGFRALIWDRPNCGESDVHFDAENESIMNTEVYAGLLSALGFGPTLLIGGSAGARVSIMTALRHPDQVAGLFLLWVVGGPLGLAVLAVHYCFESAFAANTEDMEAVANLPSWQEQIARNPENRARILAQNPKKFVETMERWGAAFLPEGDSFLPGLTAEQLGKIKAPTVVLNSGKPDLHHPRYVTEALASVIPGARLQDPPWRDTAWVDLLKVEGLPMYRDWAKLAPQVIDLGKTIWR